MISIRFTLPVLAGCLLALTPTSATGQEVPRERQPLSPITLRAPGAQATQPAAVLAFEGERYTGAWWASTLEREAEPLTDIERAVLDAVQTYADAALPEQALHLWRPTDRDEVATLMADPAAFEQNRSFYRQVTDSALAARVDYGPYRILFVQHVGAMKPFVKAYPMIQHDGAWYLTNDLQADALFQYLSQPVRKQIPLLPAPPSTPAAQP